MYRKIVWCYIIILTLLDISLNTKLTAQGKSHGAGLSVHDTLVEGISFQEWGGSTGGSPSAGGAGGARAPLRLEPAALSFGARALGAAHAHTVTLTNTGNTTLHLASVAGTTPDFHASFFDSKSLPPDGNTTFSVVYLGRREGPVSAHLYIHTALGVHKYPVSAEGVASEWGVWPLLGLRVPTNATIEPVLTLRNPTDRAVQVSEVYSSGGWVRLSLPAAGTGAVSRDAWLIPSHSARDIVKLSVIAPHHHHTTAYVRIKANITGGGLIVGVEARSAPPGEYASPVQLRLRARGHRDPHHTFSISVGSSAEAGVRLEAGVVNARCLAHAAPAPAPETHTPESHHTHNGGVKSEGAYISLLRSHLEPYQELTKAAELTLDYEKLWAGYIASKAGTENGEASNGASGASAAYCSGTVVLGRASVPYSLRLLPGTLVLSPAHIDLVTAGREQVTREVEVRATNEFQTGLHLTHLEIPQEVSEHFNIWGWSPKLLLPSASATLVKLKLTNLDPALTLDSRLVVHTNVSEYVLPLRVYSGQLDLEWEWPNSSDGNLRVGVVGTSSTRRINLVVRNRHPRALCVSGAGLRANLPGAQLQLAACAHLRHVPTDHSCRCIEGGGSANAILTIVAPARAGALKGSVSISTAHATTEAAVTLTAHAGRTHAARLHLDTAAPYAWASAPLVVENTMPLRMRVVETAPPPAHRADPALHYSRADEPAEIPAGPATTTVGQILYKPEKLCEPNCYTGLDPDSPEGESWLSVGEMWSSASPEAREAARRADRALLAARRALYQQSTRNISLYLHTTQVVQIPVTGWVRLRWPRVLSEQNSNSEEGAGWAGLAAVGGAGTLRVRARNPSRSHNMLLHPVLGPPPVQPVPDVWEGAESPVCLRESCTVSLPAFGLHSWRVLRGQARVYTPHKDNGGGTEAVSSPTAAAGGKWNQSLPVLLLEPDAEVELKVTYEPTQAAPLTAYLYLRNNLTIVEGLQLAGRGAYPSFELGGRRSGAAAPLVFEVTECGSAGVVRRTLGARNTGRVPVRLRAWRLAGQPCSARGFHIEPCAPLNLMPNQSAPLTISFTPDYTLARVQTTLQLRTERAEMTFQLLAVTPPRLLARCAQAAPRPPWEGPLRAGGSLLAFALLALVLAAGALDAERLLRRARAARAASEPRPPLDLRAVAAAPAQPPPAVPARPHPPRRRKTRKVDPQAESRAFERWRASLRRHDDDDSRSSEDADNDESHTHARTHTHADDEPLVDNAYEPEPPQIIPYDVPLEEARSSEDEPHSSESESSSPPEPYDDADEAYKDMDSPDVQLDNHRSVIEDREPEANVRLEAPSTPTETSRLTRRREPERRTDRRTDDNQRTVRTSNKHHTRKDKPSKRRERIPIATARSSPPQHETRSPTSGGNTGAHSGAGTPNAGAGASAGNVRWGASWSSVVARSTAPAPPPPPTHPIGSQPRHNTIHEPRPVPVAAPRACPSDNSLFYFNGKPTRPEPQFAWRAPVPEQPAAKCATHACDEAVNVGVSGVSGVGGVGSVVSGYGSIGPVWGSSLEARAPGAAWPWPNANNAYNSTPVRPPPGFGTTPPGAVGSNPTAGPGPVGSVGPIGTRTVRPFDPFHSLAAIWSRNALDWRADEQDDR